MKTPTLGQFTNAARLLKSDEKVPYAFEKRIMAHLRGMKTADFWSAWVPIMWRAAFSCLVISMLTGAVVSFSPVASGELFAADLERTVLAPVDVDDTW